MTRQMDTFKGPHQGQPVRTAGEPIERAQAALLMVHGRGARAEDILSLVDQLAQPGFAYLAPQAADNTWYPNRFLDPVSSNEPWLSSALAFAGEVLAQIMDAGISPGRVILLGFSQGACLTLEFAARNARRYGGLVGLSGALIGPDGTPREYTGSLAGTPVFLGCSDADFHVPKERVGQSAEVLRRLGGEVTERLYPNLDHSINQDEIDFIRSMMSTLANG
jgi:phospholipase/carboxylesterase/glyoxalase family protein